MSSKGKSGLDKEGTKEQNREKTAREFEERVRDVEDIEHLLVMDMDGNILEEIEGTSENVTSKLTREQRLDSISSHNHPPEIVNGEKIYPNCFSPDDLLSFAYNNEYEMRMVTSQFSFSLRRKDFNESSKRNTMARVYGAMWKDAFTKIEKKCNEMVANGTIPDTEEAYMKYGNELLAQMMNKWLHNNALRYGYEFSERSRKK